MSIPGSNLSPREQQVVDMVAKGLCQKTIAWLLGISLGAVSEYLHRAREKLVRVSKPDDTNLSDGVK
jgi:DNA-binding NarL/FixJ family response regulator